jgi:dephospho-CoA kinase
MAIAIGLAGLCGVGKTLAADELTKASDGTKLYLGGFILEEVKRRGLPVTPENERVVQLDVREKFGKSALANLAEVDFRAAAQAGKNIIVDSIFRWEEYVLLSSLCAPHPFIILSIHSPFDERCRRLSERPIRPFTRQQITERDENEVMRLGTGVPITLSHLQVVNDGTASDFSTALRRAWAQISASETP